MIQSSCDQSPIVRVGPCRAVLCLTLALSSPLLSLRARDRRPARVASRSVRRRKTLVDRGPLSPPMNARILLIGPVGCDRDPLRATVGGARVTNASERQMTWRPLSRCRHALFLLPSFKLENPSLILSPQPNTTQTQSPWTLPLFLEVPKRTTPERSRRARAKVALSFPGHSSLFRAPPHSSRSTPRAHIERV